MPVRPFIGIFLVPSRTAVSPLYFNTEEMRRATEGHGDEYRMKATEVGDSALTLLLGRSESNVRFLTS